MPFISKAKLQALVEVVSIETQRQRLLIEAVNSFIHTLDTDIITMKKAVLDIDHTIEKALQKQHPYLFKQVSEWLDDIALGYKCGGVVTLNGPAIFLELSLSIKTASIFLHDSDDKKAFQKMASAWLDDIAPCLDGEDTAPAECLISIFLGQTSVGRPPNEWNHDFASIIRDTLEIAPISPELRDAADSLRDSVLNTLYKLLPELKTVYEDYKSYLDCSNSVDCTTLELKGSRGWQTPVPPLRLTRAILQSYIRHYTAYTAAIIQQFPSQGQPPTTDTLAETLTFLKENQSNLTELYELSQETMRMFTLIRQQVNETDDDFPRLFH